jgi:hypothetical protein
MDRQHLRRHSHLRPPQPLPQPQPADYTLMARVLIFASLATIVIMVGFLVTS